MVALMKMHRTTFLRKHQMVCLMPFLCKNNTVFKQFKITNH